MHLGAMAALLLSVAPVDFDTEVVPILTKAGCNAAACHGAAAGRGGLKLSLFGGDPSWDYDEIVHRLESRRINSVVPSHSLIVTKPTEQVEHGGGTRFDYEGPEAKLLVRWVAEGARRNTTRRLVHLEATPAHSLLQVGDEVQLRVTASFDDGSQHNVTRSAVYSAADPAAISTREDGSLTVLRRGQHIVIVRFLDQVLTVELVTPLAEEEIELASTTGSNWIDEEISQMLVALRLPPLTAADDATLLRRLSLHLTGRLPAPEEVRDYLRDGNSDKYHLLLDRLLASDDFVDYWTHKLAQLLRIRPQANDTTGAQAFHSWLHAGLAAGRGWDAMSREMLTAEGDTHEYGPANFYLVAGDARAQAEYVSELLMGVRLRCANCHNHPLDRWTQDDYHGLAAIFARLERGRTIRVLRRGEVIHPSTGEPAAARIPGERYLDGGSDGRQELAEWLLARDNPYFARAMVNRLWKALMGRGLIEPTDDIRSTNPATHARLLDRLADDFAAHGYSIRHTLRLIASSAAYRRSSTATPANGADDRFYSRALATPLEAEVLADAISDVTGVAEPYGDEPLGTRAINLVTSPDSETLNLLGRCSREDSCAGPESGSVGLATKLHLLNGPLLNHRLSAENGHLRRMLRDGADDAQLVEEFYLRALSRPPRPDEATYWGEQLGKHPDARIGLFEDFVWSLLNSREFLTNH